MISMLKIEMQAKIKQSFDIAINRYFIALDTLWLFYFRTMSVKPYSMTYLNSTSAREI